MEQHRLCRLEVGTPQAASVRQRGAVLPPTKAGAHGVGVRVAPLPVRPHRHRRRLFHPLETGGTKRPVVFVWFGLVWFGLVWFGSVPAHSTHQWRSTHRVVRLASSRYTTQHTHTCSGISPQPSCS